MIPHLARLLNLPHWTTAMLVMFLATVVLLLIGAAILHLLPRLGDAGQRLVDRMCRGLPLDLLVTYFTALPWLVGYFWIGWAGLVGGVLGQFSALILWTFAHEFAHRNTPGRRVILNTLGRAFGRWRAIGSCYWTAWAVPLFWFVRLAEWFVYPPVSWMSGMPRYDSRDWVRVSRHKYTGLVGHDRIWCLYCDWMTGIWSLGSEMLRNVESLFCPIRFTDAAKCENCSVDFPDIRNGWVDADGDMEDVKRVLVEQYGEDGGVKPRAWFGHPSRPQGVTIRGEAVDEASD